MSDTQKKTSKGPGRGVVLQMGPVVRAMMEFGIFFERAKHNLGLAKHATNPFLKAEYLRSARTSGAHARDWLVIARKEAAMQAMESGVAV